MCLWSVIVLVSFVLVGLVGGRVFGLVGGRIFGCVLLCLMWVGPFFCGLGMGWSHGGFCGLLFGAGSDFFGGFGGCGASRRYELRYSQYK